MQSLSIGMQVGEPAPLLPIQLLAIVPKKAADHDATRTGNPDGVARPRPECYRKYVE